MALDQEALAKKNEELSLAYKEKNRKLLQTQELYDKLKRKAMLGHIQDAALDAVDNTLHAGRAMRLQPVEHGDNTSNYEQQLGVSYGAPRCTDQFGQAAVMPTPRMGQPSMQDPAWARSAPSQGASVQFPTDLNGFI